MAMADERGTSQHSARAARAGRRPVPPRRRSGARTGRARPSRRADRRCRRPAARSAEATLAALAPQLALGLTRVPMSRQIGARRSSRRSRMWRSAPPNVGADVLHGHGAKGGAYARLARGGNARSASTRRTAAACTTTAARRSGLLYLTLERVLMRRTDLFLFESAYGRDVFTAKIGTPRGAGARRAQWRHGRTSSSRVAPRAGRDRPRLHRRIAPAQGRRRADRRDRAACARRAHRHAPPSSATGPIAAQFERAGRAARA